jgi:prepilin-type N-terminal cleavage/methylation domain-containing protein
MLGELLCASVGRPWKNLGGRIDSPGVNLLELCGASPKTMIAVLHGSGSPRRQESTKEVQQDMKGLRTLRHDEKGFTLIEIMIVVLIIGILLAIAIPNFITARQTSQKKSCLSNLKQIDAAKEQWAMDGNTGTPAWTDIMGTDKYMKGDPAAPCTCPTDGSSYTVNAIGTDPTCPNSALGHVL